MKQIHKSFTVLMAGALTVSAISLCGCRKETKTQEDSSQPTNKETEITEPEFEDDQVVALNVATSDMSPIEKEAKELAEELGVTEDEIKGEYELFIRYAKIVLNNPKLHDYRAYVLHLFPVIADHYNEENIEYFFEKLADLTVDNLILGGAAGEFYGLDDKVYIFGDGGFYENEACYTTVFHELMHFTDAYLDGEKRCNLYFTGERIAKEEDLTAKEWENIGGLVYTQFLTEGGAELYQAKYYSKATLSYPLQTSFMTGLEHIYGTETLDSLFFRSDTDSLFVELLREAGYDDARIAEVFKSLNYYVHSNGDAPENPIRLEDVLIDLYVHVKGPNWQDDKVFGYILKQINSAFFDYAGCEHKELLNYMATASDMWSMTQEIVSQLDQGSNPPLLDALSLIYLDGKPCLTANLERPEDIDHNVATAIIIDYDFDNEKVNSYQYLVHSYPGQLPEKYPTGKALDERLESLKRDTSALHSQEAFDAKSKEMQEIYDRAAELGNKYGVYIKLEETLPEEFDQSDLGSPSTKKLNENLDYIEMVLEMFPDGYFDNFCYGYFTGFEIDLVRRPQNYTELRCTAKEDGYLFSIVLDGSGDNPEDEIEDKLLDAIFTATDMRMENYYENFEDPNFTEEKWKAMNCEDFRYFGYLHSEDEERDYGRFNRYVACFDAMRSPKDDRRLLMRFLLTGVNVSENCLEKAAYLSDCIREAFASETWPQETSWEKEIDRQQKDHGAQAA